MNLSRFCVALLFLSLISFYAPAQENTSKPFVKVSGELTKPLSLYAGDLAKMKLLSVQLKGKDSKMRSYTGVPLQEILALAGTTTGRQLTGENLTKYMMVKCADGYEVLFSLAELDSSFTEPRIILAYESEGKPLSAAEGPFRIVVPGEKKGARSCMQVNELVVRFAKD